MSTAYYRIYDLPWTPSEADERRVRRVLGAVLGIYADRWLETSPWLLMVFLALGAIVAFRRLIAFGKRAAKDAETPPP